MPDFVYTGSPGMYPMLRDARDVPVGAVAPGDIRELDEAPGTSWTPLDPGVQEHIEALQQITEAPDGIEPPAPAPEPAADPEPGQQDDNEAGLSGSEEH